MPSNPVPGFGGTRNSWRWERCLPRERSAAPGRAASLTLRVTQESFERSRPLIALNHGATMHVCDSELRVRREAAGFSAYAANAIPPMRTLGRLFAPN